MSLDKMPKGPTKSMADIKPKYRPEPFTLKRLLTSDEAKPYYISFLKELSNKKGHWREYYEFYLQNQSGDIESMKPDIRKYAEKLVKDVQDKYAESMN